MRTRMLVGFAALAVMLSPAAPLRAQGVLVNVHEKEQAMLPRPGGRRILPVPPIPQTPYTIKELRVDAKLVDQVATVQVSQTFANTGSRTMQVAFVFPLPYDGAIDRLTLMVDGKELAGRLLGAQEARSIYESIVRKNQDPALLEWLGTGMFKTSVFPVPPGGERKVSLRYTQICRKTGGLTDFIFPLSTAKYTTKPVEKVSVNITVESGKPIQNVYSPSHLVDVKRPDASHAHIAFEGKDQVPTTDFRLLFDIGDGKVGAKVLSYRPNASEEGYLLVLASPEIEKPDAPQPGKNVLFVVDRSGSMSGKKIEQARGALKFVLNNLREGDLFNIIAYDDSVESFRPELQRYDDTRRKEALGFVEGIYAGGSTNIDGALTAALAQLKDDKRPSYVIFLTDGLPTAGVTPEAKIVERAKSANKVHARIFAFGVGYDVNSRLLDKLVRANFGQSEYVRPNENIEARVSSFYAKVGSPVLTDVKIKFDVDGATTEEGSVVNRMYPSDTFDLFAGQQLVLVGRYRTPGDAKVTVTGNVAGREQSFDFPAKLVESSGDDANGFIEKLWAVRRVGEIIDKIDLGGKNDELVKELVALSTRHGILTPYTAFLAEEDVPLGDVTRNASRAGKNLDALKESAGASGFSQRDEKFRNRSATRAPSDGRVELRDSNDRKVVVDGVQNVGQKSFYLRDGRWTDSTVTDVKDKNVVKIERFSKQYFDLAAKHGSRITRYMALDGPVTVRIDDVTYTW